MIAGMRLVSDTASASSRFSAASTAAASRRSRTARTRAICFALERRVDAEDLDLLLVLLLVAVDADDDPLAALDLSLVAERRLGDLALLKVLLDGGDDAAELLDPVEVVVCLPLELVRQVLEVVRAAERVGEC